jgi:hypothetical protein
MTIAAPAANRLTGRTLLIGRLIWAAAALTAFISVAAGTPARYVQLLTPSPQAASVVGQLLPDEARLLAQSGLSMPAYAVYFTAAELLTALVCLGVAGLIVLGRSDEWMALYVSLILVSAGTALPLVSVLEPAHPVWGGLILGWRVVFVGGLMPLFYLFPDGHFAPGWTRWLALLVLIYTVVWPFFPPLQPPFGFGRGLVASDAPRIIWVLMWFLAGVLAQVWRYVRYSNALERQRTKWIVFGFALLLAGLVGALATLTYLPYAALGLGYLGARLAGPSLILLGLQAMAMSIGLSILRYRLWDIDVLIRRTLVYAVLTGLLALAYFVSIILLQNFFGALTGQRQSTPVTVLSTLVIWVLFVPLRSRVQAFIDRRFYRRKYDAARILAAFGTSARDDVDLDDLTERLVGVVDETMQPANVSLWIKPHHK